jgi:hypothetical protein
VQSQWQGRQSAGVPSVTRSSELVCMGMKSMRMLA